MLAENQEVVSGIIEKITYRNEANGYTVAEVKTKQERITVVGIIPFIQLTVISLRYPLLKSVHLRTQQLF